MPEKPIFLATEGGKEYMRKLYIINIETNIENNQYVHTVSKEIFVTD